MKYILNDYKVFTQSMLKLPSYKDIAHLRTSIFPDPTPFTDEMGRTIGK